MVVPFPTTMKIKTQKNATQNAMPAAWEGKIAGT